MKLRRLIILAIVLLTPNYFCQINPTDLFEFTIIDSLPNETMGTGLFYWGFGDVHLATNGERIILGAKKTYKDPATNQAKTHLLFGERQGFGKWNFDNVYDYQDSLYFGHVNAMLMHGVMPILFFNDRIDVYRDVPNEFKFVNLTGTGWVPTVMATDNDQDDIWEGYTRGFAISQGDDGATAYWFMDDPYYDPLTGVGHAKYLLLSQNWASEEKKVVWETDYDESVNLTPVVTRDGEYIAIAHNARDSLHTYWVIRAFRKTNNGYVEELADSTVPNSEYRLTIGKQSNGDVLLIANSDLANPIYRRTSNGWTKIMDNYPTGSGALSYLSVASDRYIAMERIQFSSDGTAFWGDIDGWGTYIFSAEISFYTPDGNFGHVVFPNLPGYQYGGAFEHHDFCITDDDTLHIVYNYKPSIENPPMYLVEGKLYIPDLLAMVTGIEQETDAQQPKDFSLFQNYPNPFNPTTTIRFSITKQTHVTLKVFDLLGQEIATLVDEKLTPGEHKVTFEGKNLPSGVYIYRLQAGDFYQQKKMILLK